VTVFTKPSTDISNGASSCLGIKLLIHVLQLRGSQAACFRLQGSSLSRGPCVSIIKIVPAVQDDPIDREPGQVFSKHILRLFEPVIIKFMRKVFIRAVLIERSSTPPLGWLNPT